MKKSNIKLRINEITGDYEIEHKGFSWVSDGRAPYIIIRKKLGSKYISTYRTLYSALKRKFEYSDNQIVAKLSGYAAFGKILLRRLMMPACFLHSETTVRLLIPFIGCPLSVNSLMRGKSSLFSMTTATTIRLQRITGSISLITANLYL